MSQKDKNMNTQTPQFLHFNNGIYNGYFKNDRPQGQAICLYDNGAVFIGQYSRGQLNGRCLIMIGAEIHLMGSLKKGMLHGPFVIRSPQYHIYSQTSMNSIEGQVVVIDRRYKRARVWQIEKAQATCIREGEYEQFLTEDKILRAISPYAEGFPSLLEYFTSQTSARFIHKNIDNQHKLEISLHNGQNKKICVQFQRQRMIVAGVIEASQLTGIGYIYDNKQGLELQGEIQNGLLEGEGVKRQLKTGKITYGIFSKGDIRFHEVMDLKGESIYGSLVRLKNKIHLHSLQYSNDYLNERPIYLIRNFYESIIDNEQSYKNVSLSEAKKSRALKLSRGMQTSGKSNQKNQLDYSKNESHSMNSAFHTRM